MMKKDKMDDNTEDYFVYDWIDKKDGFRKIYNVCRLENKQTNPFIRFMIVGGSN